jgi:hypothetical protein
MTFAIAIVFARVLAGIIVVVALSLASRHIVLNWKMRGKEYLVVFLVSVALDQLFTSFFLMDAIASGNPLNITWRTTVFLVFQIAAALSGGAFCAFLLGLVGSGRTDTRE